MIKKKVVVRTIAACLAFMLIFSAVGVQAAGFDSLSKAKLSDLIGGFLADRAKPMGSRA